MTTVTTNTGLRAVGETEAESDILDASLNRAHAAFEDKRWALGRMVDRDSVWWQADHPAGLRVQRSSLADLVETCNKVEVQSHATE